MKNPLQPSVDEVGSNEHVLNPTVGACDPDGRSAATAT